MKNRLKWIVPLFSLCLFLCFSLTAGAEQTPVFDDLPSAAVFFRNALAAREETFRFRLLVPESEVGDFTGENVSACYSRKLEELKVLAYAHTGVGYEGDYLKKHVERTVTSCLFSYNGETHEICFDVTAELTYKTTAAEESEVTRRLVGALAELRLSQKSEYEKIRAITDYISKTVTYDYAHLNDSSYLVQYSAYGALLNGEAVCQGYATLFYRMALEAGLDCRLITGVGNGGAHAWNIVKLGSLYYNIDPTWIDSLENDDFFLCGETDFDDHEREEPFSSQEFRDAYPMAQTRYDPASQHSHTPVADPAIPASCTENGRTAGSHCKVCGEVLTAQKEIKATGHQWNGGKTTVSPTCVKAGEKTFTCTVCGKTKTETIPASGHTPVADPAIPAACTENGRTAGSHCKVCGEVLTAQMEIKATGHQWGPGTETSGVITYTCTVCGEERTEEIHALPPAESGIPGDVNGDGTVTAADARLALRAAVGLETYAEGSAAFRAADVNGDGTVTAADARTILRAAVGLEKLTK